MTVEDYFKWHQAVWTYKVLKKETLQKAFTPFTLNDGSSTNYGYGWILGNLLGSKTIEHGGAINGFSSKEIYLPQEDILVVLFNNSTFVNVKAIADQAAAMAAGKQQFQEISIPSETKRKYIGTYKFPQGDPTTLKIYEENGQLFLKDSNSPTAWKMHFTKGNEFICYEVYPNTHIFLTGKTGEIDFLVIKNFENEIRVTKMK